MNQKSRIIFNTIINVTTNFFSMGISFFLVPFILGIIGRNLYGVWVILGSFFAYTNLLQMGLNSSITRLVPFLLAQNKENELNYRINTVVVYFSLLSLVIAIITFIAYFNICSWFSLSSEYHKTGKIMVLLIGASQIISFPLLAYGAILSGMQRYELSTGLDMIGDIARITLIFMFLPIFPISDGMIFLAGISASIVIIISAFKAILAFKICPKLIFNPWNFKLSMLWEQMLYGINSTLYILSGLLLSRLVIILLGAFATTQESADYGMAMMIIIAGAALIEALCRGIQPAASRYHGESNYIMLRELLLRSTRYNSLLAIATAFIILIFGPSFIKLWIGLKYAGIEGGAEILEKIILTSSILVIGYLMYWLVHPAYMVVNGMGRHFFPAIITISAGTLAALLVIPITHFGYSIDKVAYGIIIPMLFTGGILMPVYCCRVIQVSIKNYFINGIFKPALSCLAVALIFWGVVKIYSPENWLILIIEITLFCIVLFLLFWIFILTNNDKIYVLTFYYRIRQKIR